MDRDCGTASQVSGRSFKHCRLVNNNFASLMLTWPQSFRLLFFRNSWETIFSKSTEVISLVSIVLKI